MSARKETELAVRLDALGIAAAELAATVRRPVEDVEAWVAGAAEPDAEAKVLLRILDDDADALRRVEQLRRAFRRTWEGDHAAQDTATETVGPAVRDGERYGSAGA